MNIKSQSAIEFISLASFMLFVILGFLAITTSKMLEVREEANRKIAEDVAESAYKEIENAKSVNDGYTRVFILPETINGVTYSINITDNKELIVNYLGYEYVKFLPANVSGNISIGRNEIRKLNGIINVKNIIECRDNEDNDHDGNIDLYDEGCTDLFDIDESNCGDNVCEGGESCSICSYDCGVCSFINKLLMKNTVFNVIAFSDDGNAILKGTIQQNTNPLATSDDEFIVKDSSGNNVAIINLITGNMVIKGRLQEMQSSLAPLESSSDFIVKSRDGSIVGYIDESGNLYLKGRLRQNGNP